MATFVRMAGKQRWGRAVYYFARAEEARAIRDTMKAGSARQSMMQIAELWERMGKLEEMHSVIAAEAIDRVRHLPGVVLQPPVPQPERTMPPAIRNM